MAFLPASPDERPVDGGLRAADPAARSRFGLMATRLDLALLRAASHVGGSQGLLVAQLALEALVEHKRLVPETAAFDYADAEELLDRELTRVWLVPVVVPRPDAEPLRGVAVSVQTPPPPEHLPVAQNPARARQALLAGLRSLPVRGLPADPAHMRLPVATAGAETEGAPNRPPADLPGLAALVREARLAPVFLVDEQPCTVAAFEVECRRLGLPVDRVDCGDY